MDGPFFRFLIKQYKDDISFILKVLESSSIFARTNPRDKKKIIELYQKNFIDHHEDYFVGFCGDGANDCLALKQADIGLSLNNKEGSIASSFNTQKQSIKYLLYLIIEGKACLQQGINNFQYIASVSLAQFIGMLFLYYFNLDYTVPQYYLMDLVIFFPILIQLSYVNAVSHITKEFPPSNIFNKKVIAEFSIFLGTLFVMHILVARFQVSQASYLSPHDTGFQKISISPD